MRTPKTHTAVIAIRDANDAESVAASAAQAALKLLVNVSASQRATLVIDHVSITQPERLGDSAFGDMFAAAAGLAEIGKYAVVVVARETDAEPAKGEP